MNETLVPMGAAKVLVRYEYEPECLGNGSHPNYPASVFLREVRIDGVWIDSEELSEAWRERAEYFILTHSETEDA